MIETQTVPQPVLPPSQNGSPWRWTDVLLIGVTAGILLIGGFIAIGIWLFIAGGRLTAGSSPTPLLSLAAGGLEAVALIGSVYVVGLKRRHLDWSALGLRGTALVWLLAAVVVGLLVIPLSSLIATAVQTLLGLPMQNPQEAFLLPQGLTLPEALVMIVLVGAAGPFAEEILFRGVLYNWLRGRWGFIPSALVSSLVFGVMHVEPSIAAATFVLGFIIAGIYEWSGSLWTAVIVHATNNTAVILLLYVALAAGIKLP